MQRKDLIGQRFGKLTVNEWGGRAWRCRCDCGGERLSTSNHLLAGRNVSCGCIRPRHGGKGTAAYRAWRTMLDRVGRDWRNYAGRGITVCERWKRFQNFLADLGQPPIGGTLERIDNDRGYEPGNCRWASRKEQARNTRRTVRIAFDGREQSIAAWAEQLGIKYWTLYSRYRAGWPAERMLGNLPV